MRATTLVAIISASAFVGCSSATHEAAPAYGQLTGVSISLDHVGKAVDPLEQRMAESGRMSEATASGHDYWLKLENQSSQMISFSTMSTYLKQPIEWIDIDGGKRVIALASGSHIAARFGLESRRGTEVAVGGGDMFWISNLPPRRYVLFSVPKNALSRGRRLYLDFDAGLGSVSKRYRTYFVLPVERP